MYIRAIDYTSTIVSAKVGIPFIALTKPVEWMSLLQLIVQSRSAIVV